MKPSRRDLLSWAAAAAAVPLAGRSTFAQAYPSRPIRMIVPYTPGGYTDFMARTVGQKLSDALGQPLIYENRPGANSVIGADVVAKAAADGYTFGTVIAAHAVNASLNPKLPYDTLGDFTYVSLMSIAPLIMVAHPSLPAGSVQELVALAKAKPGTLNFASSGIGAAAHLTMELFKSRTGVDMVHVPYRGTAPALTDLIGGRVNVMIDTVGAMIPHVKAGTIKALVITGRERMAAAPGVPIMAEAGVPDFVTGTWAALLAPARLPASISDRVSGEVARILREPDMRARLATYGYEPMGYSPAETTQFIHDEMARWARVVKEAGIKMEE
ncbi:MAG: tripartite tricarboxylate transporter substrate binding protein [Hyphomicrobiales bacterium]|nr:tripartite tricarboxylate transporter substrate binding protein [Hyphomicrobiales bacterium]